MTARPADLEAEAAQADAPIPHDPTVSPIS